MATKKNAATTATTKENTVQPTLIDVPVIAPEKTTGNEKESTMAEKTNDKPVMTPEEKEAAKQARYAAHRAAHKEKVDDLLAKELDPAFDDVVWFVNELECKAMGKKVTCPLSFYGKLKENSLKELEYIKMAATMLGWTDNRLASESQAKRVFGTLKPDAVGWEVQGSDTYWFTVYPYDAFEWEFGEPKFNDELHAQREAKSAERKAKHMQKKAKELRKAAGPKPKKQTTSAPTAPVKKVYKMADGSTFEYETTAELAEILAILKSA